MVSHDNSARELEPHSLPAPTARSCAGNSGGRFPLPAGHRRSPIPPPGRAAVTGPVAGSLPPEPWRPILRVFVPFAAAFFLSYLFRSINAVIAADLASALALDAADIGLLTSVYFLSFAAVQIPVGVWLDRHGPRRVESALLPVAVLGALLFAAATGFAQLTLSRALIGIGVASAFAAGVKANAQWFPADRAATMNGWLFMLGALGALAATSPARWLLEASGGWRGLFVVLAAATTACALAIRGAVPDPPPAVAATGSRASLRELLGDPRFLRVAPLSAVCAGTAWALQGLWTAPWLADVEGLSSPDVTGRLAVMAAATGVAAMAFGTAADRLRRRGIGAGTLLAAVAAAVIAAQFALVLGWPGSSLWWPVIAAAGSVPVLSFACVAEFVPKEAGGRANGILNLFHFGGAFVVQYLVGVVLSAWPSEHGHYPPAAWHAAFAVDLGLQAAALGFFLCARPGRLPAAALHRLASAAVPLLAAVAPAIRHPVRRRPVTRSEHLAAVLHRVAVWRVAGLASVILAAGLSLTFAISGVSADVLPGAAAAPPRDELPGVAARVGHAPTDAEIAHALASFVAEVRSLSTDPAVVRANWDDALSRVTPRGALALAVHLPAFVPLDWVRRRSVTVRVAGAVRTASDTFEVAWEEIVLEDGAAPRHQRLRGTIAFAFAGTAGATFRNPLGLYVDRFT